MKAGMEDGIVCFEHRLEKGIEDELHILSSDQLYKNAWYLMLSNVVIAASGFLFWLIAARLYPPEQVGVGSALMSVMGLLVVFSTSGFDMTLIRFIPSMGVEGIRKLMSISITLSIVVSAALSISFVLLVDILVPRLAVLSNPAYALLFVLSTMFTSLFFLSNGMFIAKRKSNLLLLKSGLQSALRLLLVPLLVVLGSMGIFFAYGLSSAIISVVAILLIIRLYPMMKVCFDTKVLKKVSGFLGANYISTIFGQLPNFLFPIIVLNLTSKAGTAYFYVPWHIFITYLGFMVAVNSAFLMEGSYEKDIDREKKKALNLSLLLTLGGLVLFLAFGEFILSLFGEGYAASAGLLHVLAVSLIPTSINLIYLTVKDIRKEITRFAEMNVFIYASCLIMGTLFIPSFGILGVGYGWLGGQLLGLAWICKDSCLVRFRRRKHDFKKRA